MTTPRKPPIKKMETKMETASLTTDFDIDDRIPKLHPDHIAALVAGSHPQPHADLGQHAVTGGMVIAVLRPLAETVTAIQADGTRVELQHTDQGLWQGFAPGPARLTRSRPPTPTPRAGPRMTRTGSYRRSARSTSTCGARAATSSSGTCSAHTTARTRASRERRSRCGRPTRRPHELIGEFNGWNGASHAMRRLDDNGVWELFVPGLEPNATYKFELLTQDGRWVERADPMARWAEVPPATASRVVNSIFAWSDRPGWMPVPPATRTTPR